MRALVTGAGGFCGRHLVKYITRQGVEVHAVSQRTIENATCHIVDPTSVKELSSAISRIRPKYVFHLAGISTSADPTLFYRINTAYAAALLRALELSGYGDCPTLLVGTSAEYGLVAPEQLPIREDLPARPYNHHGISKLAQTLIGQAAAKRGQPVVIVRPFNILGPGMPNYLVAQSFALQIKRILRSQRPMEIKVGNLHSSRDFIDIDEVLRIYWDILQTPSAYGEIINVCSGKGVFTKDLLATLIKLSQVDIEVKIDPARFKEIDVPLHYGSPEKLKGILGYTPKNNLENTLKRILDRQPQDEKIPGSDKSCIQ